MFKCILSIISVSSRKAVYHASIHKNLPYDTAFNVIFHTATALFHEYGCKYQCFSFFITKTYSNVAVSTSRGSASRSLDLVLNTKSLKVFSEDEHL